MARNATQAGSRNRRVIGWSAAALLLLAPLLAMQVSDDMAWDTADFAMLAAMLVTAGVCVEVLTRFVPSGHTRRFGLVAVLAAFLVIFADAAVGIFPG